MTLDEIKKAVDDGKTVHWANPGYIVVGSPDTGYVILFRQNDHCIGLTWRDGVTLNGKEEEFFVGETVWYCIRPTPKAWAEMQQDFEPDEDCRWLNDMGWVSGPEYDRETLPGTYLSTLPMGGRWSLDV